MKKIILASIILVASFFSFIPGRLKAQAQGTGVPVLVTFTTSTEGFQVATTGSNGVYLDGLIVGQTAPNTQYGVVTFQLHDLASATALTTSASLKLAMAVQMSPTAQVITIPATGIFFANGIRYVDANTTTVTATFVTSTR